MSRHLTKATAAIGLACTLPLFPVIAASDGRSAVVRFADLDLATVSGQRALRARVARAAAAVCDDPASRGVRSIGEAARCRKIAIAGVAPRIDRMIASARPGVAYAANLPEAPRTAGR